MRMSTKGRYAARAMLELAMGHGKEPLLLRDIAARQEISEKYLERIMTTLVSSGLARSQRGQNGGFTLARSPEQIRLSEVVRAAEGSLAPVPCVDDAALCDRADACVTRDIWERMKEAMLGVLDSVTLAEMVSMQRKKTAKQGAPLYHI